MTPIFDSKDLPGFKIHFRQTFAIQKRDWDFFLSKARSSISRQAAEKIVEQPRFFRLEVKDEYCTVEADMIVMTQDEYCEAMQKKFREGIDHANGFVSRMVFKD